VIRTRVHRSDPWLLAATLALLVIGILSIFSATIVETGASKVVRQAIWMVVGLLGMGVVANIDYRIWARHWLTLYGVVLAALLLTLVIAPAINGARSWIEVGALRVQPSEFAKWALILTLAAVLTRVGGAIQRGPVFMRSLALFGPPVALILVQPDFGTAMVLCAIWGVMVWVAGARGWMLAAVCLGAVLCFVGAWHGGLIKEYQKRRLDFVHADPAGSGYHQRQARIAIGAGQWWGKGYLRGTQAQRGFLPEQETDFIYAVIGEEWGFAGSLFLLGIYGLLCLRLLRVAEEAESMFGRLLVCGVLGMILTHLVINVGMCLTLLPVTGVPLPLVSYGGSNLMTTLLGLGVALNVSRHREPRRAWAADMDLIRV
jgi:rod shape determining protein RodA